MPGFLIWPRPLRNFKIQKHYQNEERKIDGVYSRNNLLKVKDWAYVIYRHEFKSRGTHWIFWYVNSDNVTYFDSFRVEHIPKEIKKFIRKKNIKQIFIEYKNSV